MGIIFYIFFVTIFISFLHAHVIVTKHPYTIRRKKKEKKSPKQKETFSTERKINTISEWSKKIHLTFINIYTGKATQIGELYDIIRITHLHK